MTRLHGPATVALRPFAVDATFAVRAIEVRISRPAPARLLLKYELQGDLAGVLLAEPVIDPAAQEPDGRTAGLWRHTCMEVFVATADVPAVGPYLEFNFGTGGRWAAYRFSGYRADMAPLQGITPPRIDMRIQSDRLLLTADLELPAALSATTVRLAVTAVIENTAGELSYWALRHAGKRPDFHHPDSFEFEI